MVTASGKKIDVVRQADGSLALVIDRESDGLEEACAVLDKEDRKRLIAALLETL